MDFFINQPGLNGMIEGFISHCSIERAGVMDHG